MNLLSTQVFRRPCVPILRSNAILSTLLLQYRFRPNIDYTAQISAQRLGSTRAGPGHGRLAAKLEKPLTILEKLQAKSNTANPDTTGFIALEENERLLFFDNIFPLKTFSLDFRNAVLRLTPYSPDSSIRNYIPPNLEGFKLLSVYPRPKDGGAYVKFAYDPSVTTPREIESSIQSHLHNLQIRPLFAPLRPLRAYLVQGIPWTEDLYRFPSARLKVEFVSGPELSEESLYSLFRRFGKISEIVRQPGEGKGVQGWAVVQFLSVRSASAARCCLHRAGFAELSGARIGTEGIPTVLRVQYERTAKVHWLRDWIFSHPRIVIPALAAIIATITVAIFDPIRTWFIKAKVTGALSLSEYEPFKWVSRHTSIFPFNRRPTPDANPLLLSERSSTIETLRSWLLDTSETFIIVQGPRGSGKRELVLDHVLPPRKNVLIIDCEPITEAHGDTATIASVAQQVGYRPVFSWMNTISSLADLAAQGTIGTSAGFSQTMELQFSKILQNAGTALREIALQDRDALDKDANLSDEEYLSAHPEKRPVVVIDNFLHSPEGTIIYDRLASWAALLVSASVAHVIFLTNDVSFSKSLSKSLPDRVFRSVLLGDASAQSAKTFVLNALAEDTTEKAQKSSPPSDGSFNSTELARKNAPLLEEELDASIAILGGRLTDLEALATRIRSGEGPRLAVSQIVSASAVEINKLYLSPDQQHNDPKSPRKWSTEQAWYLITLLDAANAGSPPAPTNPSVNTPNNPKDVESGSINYNSILLHPLFKSPSTGEESLQSLAHSDLITILTHPSGSGRPYAIRPGRPVYKAAFRKLLEDEVLKAKMELAVLNVLVKIEEGYMKRWEEELAVLATCGGAKDAGRRMDYLGKKIGGSQERVDGYEKEMEGRKKILQTRF
ncbi:RNA12 protein-domain-containing protein [Terfezia claveryi]|nr:RNA12 protein-domain-containing protein [Terfezia claveryi]